MSQLNVDGLGHIGVIVSDIDASRKFYTEILDCTVTHSNSVSVPEGTVKVCFVTNGNLEIELIQEAGPFARNPDGIVAHIAFKCTNIDACFAELKARGVELLTSEIQSLPHFFENGCRYFLFKGPDGETLELNEVA